MKNCTTVACDSVPWSDPRWPILVIHKRKWVADNALSGHLVKLYISIRKTENTVEIVKLQYALYSAFWLSPWGYRLE